MVVSILYALACVYFMITNSKSIRKSRNNYQKLLAFLAKSLAKARFTKGNLKKIKSYPPPPPKKKEDNLCSLRWAAMVV